MGEYAAKGVTAKRVKATALVAGHALACAGTLLAPTSANATTPDGAAATGTAAARTAEARAAAGQRSPAVTITDRLGDHTLIDALPKDRYANASDIRTIRFEKINGALRITTTIGMVGINASRQYAVTSFTVPSGLKYLVQAMPQTTRAEVAKQSWRNAVSCPDARSGYRAGSPGAIIATIPLKCLGKPKQITNFTAYSFTEVYHTGYSEYVAMSEDDAAGPGVLRLG